MKFPEPFTIEWHQHCLHNRLVSLSLKDKKLKELQEEVTRDQQGVYFYEKQIEEAIIQGKDKFDSEKFMIPRKKK